VKMSNLLKLSSVGGLVKNVLRLQSPSRTTTTCPHCQNPLGPKIRVGAVPTQTIFITSKQLFIIIITLLLNDCVISLSVLALWSQTPKIG
jgi:hypothetical protein